MLVFRKEKPAQTSVFSNNIASAFRDHPVYHTAGGQRPQLQKMIIIITTTMLQMFTAVHAAINVSPKTFNFCRIINAAHIQSKADVCKPQLTNRSAMFIRAFYYYQTTKSTEKWPHKPKTNSSLSTVLHLCEINYYCVPKKWRQSSNHYNYGTPNQN